MAEHDDKAILRKLARTIRRRGQDSDVWPMVLLLFAVLVPAVCLLWFMDAAMRNERFAVQQKLADVYRSQLSATQVRLAKHWDEMAAELEKLARTDRPSAAFARCVQSGSVDSVIIFDEPGRVLYPDVPSAIQTGATELESKWAEASRLEYFRKDLFAAAIVYDALAKEATNVSSAARALQAEARCLVQAGQNAAAIRLVEEALSHARFDRATDPQGRLIVANAELMELELIADGGSPAFQAVALRLKERLMDYDNPTLAAPQRRFLMKELQGISPQPIQFPTLAAEEWAAQFCEAHPGLVREAALQRSPIPDLWQFTTPDQRVLALVRTDKLLASMRTVVAAETSSQDAEIKLLPPGAENIAAFVSLPAGARWPGWQLALSLKDRDFFEATTAHRTTVYLWTGVLVVAAMGVLTLLAIRLLRRQAALARLKNDLAATISHELKTPLSSMRVLVDTLLDSDKLDEHTTREYLQLIARENERLSRLIQNFLTFSRMEQRKHVFHFATLPARQIVDTAVEAVRERFVAPGCRFEVQVQDELPPIMADPDAMPTALINLLDNAWKYSEDTKHIILRASADNGSVLFSVQDNGIGIAPRETEKVFRQFYQVDQRLSRDGGGCGLGLSIVQLITRAHQGSVSLESQPGRGSTFTISVPVALAAMRNRQEAIA